MDHGTFLNCMIYAMQCSNERKCRCRRLWLEDRSSVDVDELRTGSIVGVSELMNATLSSPVTIRDFVPHFG